MFRVSKVFAIANTLDSLIGKEKTACTIRAPAFPERGFFGMMKYMKISFHGGDREVTGACHLVESGKTRILVDCGMFQGSSEAAERNADPFSFSPKDVAALLVSHAHMDHIGRIPKLAAEGFSGTIYSTPPTRDLSRLLLEDALSLAERGEEPRLYGEADLARAFERWETVAYDEPFEIGGADVSFLNAGHILGSALIDIRIGGTRLLFTGDLGNEPSALLPSHEAPKGIEYLVIESAYGNRTHEKAEERVLLLERAVEEAAAQGGTLLIPAFATERTQDILFLLNEMLHFKRIPEMPMFVDSPLAIRVTEVFERYAGYYKEEIKKLFFEHPNLFKFKRLRFTESAEESKAINAVPPPKVIIAGSGMMTGGRILHHAKRYLPEEQSMLLITGYQAAGSLGRRLLDGADEVRIHNESVAVRAHIRKINGFSAHADNPQLFSFVENIKDTLRHVFVVQGEEAAATHFAQELRDRLGIRADAPGFGQEFEF